MTLPEPLLLDSKLDAVFAALADPTRRAILQRLSHGDARLGEIASLFPMSQPAISKHIRVLENAGLVTRGTSRQHPLHFDSTPLAQAVRWLEDFLNHWNGSFDQLDGLLRELQSPGSTEHGA